MSGPPYSHGCKSRSDRIRADRTKVFHVPGPSALEQVEMTDVAARRAPTENGPAKPSPDNPTDKTRLVDDNGRAVLPAPNDPADQVGTRKRFNATDVFIIFALFGTRILRH